MDAFTDSATQGTLTNLLSQLNLLTIQLKSIQLHDVEFEANVVQVYPTVCRYCNEPHMSIDCQMKDTFAQVQPTQLPQEKTLSIPEMANTQDHYMGNAYTKFMDEISQAPKGENLSIAEMASPYIRFMDDAKKKVNKVLLEEQQ